MRERFAAVTSQLLDKDPRVGLVLAEISVTQFASAIKRYPDRAVTVGIREQLMIGVAGGLALAGLRPIVHSYGSFLVERPFEQVKLDLGHQGLGAVLVSIGASHDWAAGGRTHHCPSDVALLDTLPGWTVHVPGHADEVEALLRSAIAADGRVYIRLSEQMNTRAYPTGTGWQTVRQGGRATVIVVGPMLDRTLAATADMDVTVLYASTVRPFDLQGPLAALSLPDVVLIEPYLEGTSVALVSEALAIRPHRIQAIGVRRIELRRYGSAAEHDAAHGLDVEGLRSRIAGFLDPRTVAA